MTFKKTVIPTTQRYANERVDDVTYFFFVAFFLLLMRKLKYFTFHIIRDASLPAIAGIPAFHVF